MRTLDILRFLSPEERDLIGFEGVPAPGPREPGPLPTHLNGPLPKAGRD